MIFKSVRIFKSFLSILTRRLGYFYRSMLLKQEFYIAFHFDFSQPDRKQKIITLAVCCHTLFFLFHFTLFQGVLGCSSNENESREHIFFLH